MQTWLTLICAGIVGTVLMGRHPFPGGDGLLQMVLYHRPMLFHALHWTWVAMLFTTPAFCFSGIFSLIYIFVGTGRSKPMGDLPPFPAPDNNAPLHVVVGEVHHPRKAVRVERPSWLTIPERGLHTAIIAFGAIGTGKTTCVMRPVAQQILSWNAGDPKRRIGALVLEVKGDFCHQVRAILKEAKRPEDYTEISLDGAYRYNPLHNDLDASALAYSIASLLNNLYGRGKEPFWQQAYTNLVKFIILLHKVVDGYCTLFQVYECAINPEKLQKRITEGAELFAKLAEPASAWILIDPNTYLAHEPLGAYTWETVADTLRAPYTAELAEQMQGIEHQVIQPEPRQEAPDLANRVAQFEAVRRWFEFDWMRIEPKLRTSIVEGISVFLSVFDENPRMKRVFCPPKDCYDTAKNKEQRYGVPLPPFSELIEQGKVVALNFPTSANPGLSKVIGTMMKQDFQRAMLGRIPKMAANPTQEFRHCLFLVDEYQAFATAGENDPTGDEKFFALSRQAKCIPVVATQSISSLRSTLPGESWRTLVQTFRTKIFLATSDDFTAKTASEMCGMEYRLTPSFSMSESGQDAQVSKLSGRALAHKASMTISKSFNLQRNPIFDTRVFTELKNAQAVVLAYNGTDPLPATLVMLKPWFLDRNQSYFEQAARGKL